MVGLTILTADDTIRCCWGFVARPSSWTTKVDVARGLLHKEEVDYSRHLIVGRASYNRNNDDNNWNQNFGGPPPPPPPPYYQNDPNYQGPYFDNDQDYDQPGGMYDPQSGGRGPQQQPPWGGPQQGYDDNDPGFYPPQNENFGPYFDERQPPRQRQQQRMPPPPPPPPNQRPLDSNYQQMNTRRDPTGSLGKPMGPSFGEKREDPREDAIGPKGGNNRRFDSSFQGRQSDSRGPPQSFYGSPPPPPPPRMDQRNQGQRNMRQPFEENRGFNNNYNKNERSFRPDTSLNSNEASPSGASLFNPPPDPSRRRPNQRPLDSNYERATSRQDPFGSLGQPMGPSFGDRKEDPREISVGPRGPNSGPPFPQRQQQNPFDRRGDSFNQPPPFNMRPPDARQAPGSFYGAPPPPVGQRPGPRQAFNDRGPASNFNQERVFRPDNSLNANEAYRSASSYNPASAYQPRRQRSLGDPIGPSFADDKDPREISIGPAGANMGYKRGSQSQRPPQAWGRSVGDPIGPSFADDKEPREAAIGPRNDRKGGSREPGQQSTPGAQGRYRQQQEGPQSYTYRPVDQTRPDAYTSSDESYRGGASRYNPASEFIPRQASRPLDSNYKPTRSRMDPVRSLGDPLGASFADVKEDPREILVGPKEPEKPPRSQQSASSFASNTAPSYETQQPYSTSSNNQNEVASYQQTERSSDGRQESFYSESVYKGNPDQPPAPNTHESRSDQSGRKDYSFFGTRGPGERTGVNQSGVSPPFPASPTNSNQNERYSAPHQPGAPPPSPTSPTNFNQNERYSAPPNRQPLSSPSYYGGPPLRTEEPSRWQVGTTESEEDEVSVQAEVINESGVSPPFPSQSSGFNPNPFNSGTTTGYRPESVYGGAGVGVRDNINEVGVSPPFPKAQTFISEEEAEARTAEARKNEGALPNDSSLVPTGDEKDTRDREYLWYHEKTYTVRYKD
uniref:Uncharacterized protein n=1 Tax=Amphora coffeiformis TaxID=265554 RepID=A0A7S3L400_9STRA